MCSSMHLDNRNKNILVSGDGLKQGLDDTTVTAGVKYPINFTQSRKRFALSLHYNATVHLLMR